MLLECLRVGHEAVHVFDQYLHLVSQGGFNNCSILAEAEAILNFSQVLTRKMLIGSHTLSPVICPYPQTLLKSLLNTDR